jgi:hypothetical protein
MFILHLLGISTYKVETSTKFLCCMFLFPLTLPLSTTQIKQVTLNESLIPKYRLWKITLQMLASFSLKSTFKSYQ